VSTIDVGRMLFMDDDRCFHIGGDSIGSLCFSVWRRCISSCSII